MFRHEFEALWAERDKCVMEDITWRRPPGVRKDLFCFDYVPVVCQSGIELGVNGSYSCPTGASTFNFTVNGLGPISRYCVGGTEHKEASRYHQHILIHEKHVRQNLPYAEARPNMEGMTPKQAWDYICQEADITHTGQFFEPEVDCP